MVVPTYAYSFAEFDIDRRDGCLKIGQQAQETGLDDGVGITDGIDGQPAEQGTPSVNQHYAQGEPFDCAHSQGLTSPNAISLTDAAPRHCAP